MQRFIILAGMPGSGKSTLGRRLKERDGVFVVSTDAIRLAFNAGVYPQGDDGGDYAVLDPVVFAAAELAVRMLLQGGQSVALDATNLSRARRAEWATLARATAPGVRVEVVWCTGTWDSADRWLTTRGVPPDQHARIIDKLRRSVEVPTADEADLVTEPTLAPPGSGG